MTLTFDELGLAEPIQRALSAENHITPTPIQGEAIPFLMQGRDLLGVAQTGTGKTAAFALPILHHLATKPVPRVARHPYVLILAPTRELAGQIHERVRAYGRHLKLRSAVVFGGVGQRQQVKALADGLDILIATPGRLLDLYTQGHVKFDRVGILVLDEADRMLDMGFIRDVRKIVGACSRERQTLFFSATMPPDIAKLAQEILSRPVRVDVSPQEVTVDRVDQRVMFVPAAAKLNVLADLLSDAAMDRVIVFTRTKRGADRVCRRIEQAGFTVEAIHGNKAQNARVRALENFRSGRVRILVATDIAARGIDIPAISHVINFELPNEPESYVHRIGRTARAGADGIALSLCDGSEQSYLRSIERLTRNKLTVVPTLHSTSTIVSPSERQAPVRHTPARHDDERPANRRPQNGHRRPNSGGAASGDRASQQPWWARRNKASGQRRRAEQVS